MNKYNVPKRLLSVVLMNLHNNGYRIGRLDGWDNNAGLNTDYDRSEWIEHSEFSTVTSYVLICHETKLYECLFQGLDESEEDMLLEFAELERFEEVDYITIMPTFIKKKLL